MTILGTGGFRLGPGSTASYGPVQGGQATAAEWVQINPVLPLGWVGVESDTSQIKFGNGVNDWNTLPYYYPTRLGDVLGGDYTGIEADGTVRFLGDATVFNDINISGNSLGVGPVAPGTVALVGSNILTYAFIGTGVQVDELHGSVEILHDYEEGSEIVPHVHWMPTTNDAGNVKWQMEYIWFNRGATAGASATISTVAAAGGTAWVGHISSFPGISGVGMEMGSRFSFRIFRDPADGSDTYEHPVALLDIGIHYEVDTIGSRTVGSK